MTQKTYNAIQVVVAFAWAFGMLALVIGVALLSGCRSENTGVSAAVGDITTLPEISDASDNVSVKVLYMMTGARVWTAKDSNVTVKYRTCHTNDYLGVFHRRGTQDLEVTVEPVEYDCDSCTNGLSGSTL